MVTNSDSLRVDGSGKASEVGRKARGVRIIAVSTVTLHYFTGLLVARARVTINIYHFTKLKTFL